MDEPDWIDRFLERAGHLEYDCGYPRKRAEYQARAEVLEERKTYRKNLTPVPCATSHASPTKALK